MSSSEVLDYPWIWRMRTAALVAAPGAKPPAGSKRPLRGLRRRVEIKLIVAEIAWTDPSPMPFSSGRRRNGERVKSAQSGKPSLPACVLTRLGGSDDSDYDP